MGFCITFLKACIKKHYVSTQISENVQTRVFTVEKLKAIFAPHNPFLEKYDRNFNSFYLSCERKKNKVQIKSSQNKNWWRFSMRSTGFVLVLVCNLPVLCLFYYAIYQIAYQRNFFSSHFLHVMLHFLVVEGGGRVNNLKLFAENRPQFTLSSVL